MIFVVKSWFKIFLLLLSLIIGNNAQKPRSLAQKVNILERRMNSESNLRSQETAIIFQRLDEIDQNVNRSLEKYEEMCSAETGNEDDKTLSNEEEGDLANDLINSETLRTVRNAIIKLYRAFGKEKLLHAEMRGAFPNLRKEVGHCLKLNSDLKNEIEVLKSEKAEQNTEIIQLKLVNRDLQNTVELLTGEIQIIEDESHKCATENTKQDREIKELKLANSDLQNTIKMMANDITNVKNDISKFATNILHIENKTDELNMQQRTFSSCADAFDKGFRQSGTYNVFIDSASETLNVYCDQETADGGWIVFQRRMDGSEDFYCGWEDYKNGFGNLQGEFWLGNKYLNALTAVGEHELRIDMEDFDGNKAYAQYSTFKINRESQKYKLEVGGFHGNASDSLMLVHNDQEFSTWDNDNDDSSSSCAKSFIGAWWYTKCYASNLNGKYRKSEKFPKGKGIIWYYWKGSSEESLKFTEMKLR